MTSQLTRTGGSVYLLHFEPGLPVTGNRVARHYLGFAEHDVDARVAQHCAGRALRWSLPCWLRADG